MKKTALCIFVLTICAQAGVLRVVTYPVRHPVKTFRPLVFPIVHPVRFWV